MTRMENYLSSSLGARLLRLARETIGFRLGTTELIDQSGLDGDLLQNANGTFVTIKKEGKLRGCIGNLEPSGTILESVSRNALSAAFNDYRFSPLRVDEFPEITIDISILALPAKLPYQNGNELLDKLQPGIDGVILQSKKARATFLPQVWEQLPDPVQFLEHLCIKAGLSRSAWRDLHPDIWIYQVQCFEEKTS